ncbi:MAG: hypothetical protein QOH90_2075 [Actinomycetota bacterium]|nr:hypothetical protein [Actinomycetota bacterium]
MPIVFGAICGWLLGVDKIAYLVLSILAILGGYVAGQEHKGLVEGAIRGLVGGALFGGSILLVHEATGKAPKADLPDPKILLLAITVGVGVFLGGLGGRARGAHDEEEEEEGPPFDIRRIKRFELIGFAGSAILLFSLFLTWFSTSCPTEAAARKARQLGDAGSCNGNSMLHGTVGDFNAFKTYGILDVLLVAACIAPFVLAYIIARGHELTWRPGEVTMIVGIVAFALILVNGVIFGRPGGDSPSNVEISLGVGYYVGLFGSFMIAFGGFVRQASAVRSRKPPGVL